MERKQALLINRHQIGYLPMGGAKTRSADVNKNTRHDLKLKYWHPIAAS